MDEETRMFYIIDFAEFFISLLSKLTIKEQLEFRRLRNKLLEDTGKEIFSNNGYFITNYEIRIDIGYFNNNTKFYSLYKDIYEYLIRKIYADYIFPSYKTDYRLELDILNSKLCYKLIPEN